MRAIVFPDLRNELYNKKHKVKVAQLTFGNLMLHLIKFSIYFKAVHYLSVIIYFKNCAILKCDSWALHS